MLTLLLDSSNTNLSVGILKDDKIIYQVNYPCWQRQSELMIPEIEKSLKTMNLKLKDFDSVVCGKGPGSYTGIRISLTIAKILAQMIPCKLFLISSLRIMGNRNLKFISLMNARSSRSYIGVYNHDVVILEDCVMTNDQVKEYINNHKDYVVIGDTSYLGIEAMKPNEIEGLVSFMDVVEEEKNILSVKPVYLKDNYGI